MLPIKLRAWSHGFEQMISWEELKFDKDPGDDEICFYEQEDGSDSEWDGFADYTIMLSTSNLDTDGVEIYESDIVEISSDIAVPSARLFQHGRTAYGKGERFVVHRNITGFELRHVEDWVSTESKNFPPNGYRGKPYVDNHAFWNLQRNLKVIGNIYENEDLLEVS